MLLNAAPLPLSALRDFAQRLWGDIYFDEATRGFKRKSPAVGASRTFVTFILEPLYKVYSQVRVRQGSSGDVRAGSSSAETKPCHA